MPKGTSIMCNTTKKVNSQSGKSSVLAWVRTGRHEDLPLGMQTWWRHQMEIFSALLALSVGNSPVTGEFPSQRPVTRSFDVFLDLRLNKRLNKQSCGWWFETPSCSSWRNCNEISRVKTEGHKDLAWGWASDKQAGFKNIWIYLRMDNSRFKDRQIERFTDRSGRVNVTEILTEVRKKKWLNDTPWLIQVTS